MGDAVGTDTDGSLVGSASVIALVFGLIEGATLWFKDGLELGSSVLTGDGASVGLVVGCEEKV